MPADLARYVGVSPPTLSAPVIEKLIGKWMDELERGIMPVLDLSPFTNLRLNALTILLTFAHAGCAGLLLEGTRLPPFPLILPNSLVAQNHLLRLGFFTLAAQPEVFVGAIDLARYEQRTAPAVRGTYARPFAEKELPQFPFHRVVPAQYASLGGIWFENECVKFINELNLAFREALQVHLGFDRKAARDFWMPNIEIVRNIYMHSASWGFGVLQCDDAGVTMCYADLGMGVRNSLATVGKLIAEKGGEAWDDATAIAIAFREGVTSLPGESQGYGLPVTKKYVLDCNGFMELRSGAAKLTMSSLVERTTRVRHLPGAQIGMYLPRVDQRRSVAEASS